MYKSMKYSSLVLIMLMTGCSTGKEPNMPSIKVEQVTTSYTKILPKFNKMIDVFSNQRTISLYSHTHLPRPFSLILILEIN